MRSRRTRHSLRLVLGALLLLFLLAEASLRIWGMRRYPLYRVDDRYEYFTLPDQDARFGRIRFSTNAWGMRSTTIGPKRRKRVLVAGDSVINGGYQTTQDSLATAIVEREWPDSLGIAPEVINLSAGSWGAGNVAAFLKAHGLFEADLLVVVLSSHDAFDHMTFEPVVGVHPSYPDHVPTLALAMLWRKWRHAQGWTIPLSKERLFDPGWKELTDLCSQARVPLVVLLHPERQELLTKRYDGRGKVLLDSLRAWQVPVVPLLGRLHNDAYTDRIHLNSTGQRHLARVLVKTIARY